MSSKPCYVNAYLRKPTSQVKLMEVIGPQPLALGDALEELERALPE